ncbi:6,7-dimethyl-8-ribityllumazine synthase domain-containing protein [Hirsutella rhossiliensis]|uniref:6,7-dimethyl-8-ribityllumazine synthase n=1 Tax=Hirsutella rhossiliensis TaxID=111463 RepID=A0A9P8MM21_9HYPO|nr:6,7-dimethyl-8-ribityllumazine synthase domain-containing protein [Hirsutella rhossiliensis]KAH0957472.1 6,7-dimethyl-8-ribityllumazine synthase domain-containing protein [Hirsutella rhossiliensis]
MSLKGPSTSQRHHDGSALRVAIVHACWNMHIIKPLVAGAKEKLLSHGVKESNIVVQSCPGSWELPLTVQRVFSASQIQSTSTGGPSATDLLASSATDLTALASAGGAASGAFDAIIAIGVLIKGETMHFEYISDAVSHGLMRVQLDTGVPVIFGVLTVLSDDQAKSRAGVDGKGHNHGESWASAAVEMGVKRKQWAAGRIEG